MKKPLKGRGAQGSIHNRFHDLRHEPLDDYLNHIELEGEYSGSVKTQYIPVHPKSFVNKIDSPDVRMGYSANPYQGCEHGCVYCYARNSHEYWGYGAGIDFESKVLYKENAPQLLESFIRRKAWLGETIVFSGNTDPYQPAEQSMKITRACLEVMHRWKHPTGIITKNALVLRDLDLLQEMAKINTVGVHISVTSLKESTRRLLEPRTTTIKLRLKAIESLSLAGIPVNVMIAPVIPSLNSHELLDIVKAVADRGAKSVAHTVVRLNGQIATIFEDWARSTIPGKADRILSLIAQCHGGQVNDSEWGRRMRGDGSVAKQIADMIALGKSRYLKGRNFPKLDNSHFLQLKDPQMSLF